ncbi:hypothetical protein LR48_Vigan04g148800 [Vigna angularis]|uniref:Uncharacterized protein n=1 Tax=Phaseolus angularis TaxID=3914 RepID=A0A0L9UEC6_PHAAN|nr:hypothetical protein LR48_Vigan04g148800 [Vigna angularis]
MDTSHYHRDVTVGKWLVYMKLESGIFPSPSFRESSSSPNIQILPTPSSPNSFSQLPLSLVHTVPHPNHNWDFVLPQNLDNPVVDTSLTRFDKDISSIGSFSGGEGLPNVFTMVVQRSHYDAIESKQDKNEASVCAESHRFRGGRRVAPARRSCCREGKFRQGDPLSPTSFSPACTPPPLSPKRPTKQVRLNDALQKLETFRM